MGIDNNSSKFTETVKSLKLRKHLNDLAPIMAFIFIVGWMGSFGFLDCYPANPRVLGLVTSAPAIETLIGHNPGMGPLVSEIATDYIKKNEPAHQKIEDLAAKPIVAPILFDEMFNSIDNMVGSAVNNFSEKVEAITAESEPQEPETFREFNTDFVVTNDIVYTHGTINARYGPDRDYNVVMKIPEGAEVQRIAVGCYGWDKVVYNGTVMYAWHKYLHTDPVN